MAGDPVFPPEIWLQIIPYAKNNHAPLSSPPREELQQPRLCALARTCRLLRDICTPILYTHITTDAFATLIWHALRPDTPISRFHITQTLLIENNEKLSEPTYLEIMGNRARFWAYAPTFEGERHENMRCAIEVVGLSHEIKAANQAGGLPALFPNLTSIAVASIYGSAEEDWRRYEGTFPKGQQKGNVDCAELFERFLLSGSALRHFCTREPGGPLSILPISTPRSRTATDNLPTITTHFGLGTNYLLLPVGLPIKWISDTPQCLDWAGRLQGMGTGINRLLYQRATYRGGEHTRCKADVEIHFSTPLYGRTRFEANIDVIGLGDPLNLPSSISPPRTLTPDVQRMMASKLGGLLQNLFRKHGHPADTVSWHISAGTPVCQACLCGPPQ